MLADVHMHPAFTAIQFGPFASTYHRETVTDDFKEAFFTFLERELLSQVEQPYEFTTGHLVAAYDDQKYCGPRSAVRDIYTFEFAFHRASENDTIKVELVYDPATRKFTTRQRRPFYLWSTSRRERHQRERREIQNLCERIADHKAVNASCPLCSEPLQVIDSPSLFDVRCPKHCFNYNFHRDPTNGAFLHGHFIQNEAGHTA